jgi:hypothetical protein
MHDCQRFREDWIGGSMGDPADCDECRQFCEEADAVMVALDASASRSEPLEEYWAGFDNRLRRRLIDENALMTRQRAWWMPWAPALASAAVIVIAVAAGGFFRNSGPTESGVVVRVEDNHIEDLDPGVVRYLSQAELDLRNFTKIEPSYAEEIKDARARASRSLASIDERKNAAGDFAPVRMTLDEYESVLREIKNLDSPEDIEDVQMRIRRNGLIAKMKAYQPRVVLASTR